MPEDDPSTSVRTPANRDIVRKSVGSFGIWHFWITFAIFLVKFPVAWHQLSIVFLAPKTNFTCKDNKLTACDSDCPGHNFDRSIFTETIVTQWDLVCTRSYLASFAQTVTMLGILVGNMLFGYFADRFGRKNPLTAAVVLQAVTGTCAAVVPWFTLFLIMRFLAAFATGGTMIISFVLLMELIGVEWRTFVGIIYQIPFNLGHLTLPLFSYLMRDWKYYQMTISIPSIFLLSYYWILPESPRYLLTTGKEEKAIQVLEKGAKRNKLPTDSIRDDVHTFIQRRQFTGEKKGGNIVDLFRTSVIRTYTFCAGYCWFICGLCFYGSAQYISHLSGNIFVNVAISAVIQIPGTLFSVWSVKAWGRKGTLVFSNALSAISCLLLIPIPLEEESWAWATITLSAINMFSLMVSFPTVYVYSGELFPTVVRNVGVGTTSMCARIGSMAAPFVAGLVTTQEWLPPFVFGLIPLIGAGLVLLLPETLDCKLPDTVEDAELLAKRKWKHTPIALESQVFKF